MSSSRISLRLYATLSTAEHVGAPIDELLLQIKLAPTEWTIEKARWARELADHVDDEDYCRRYDQAVLDARGRFRRSLAPLDVDVRVWIAFLAHWSRATDPTALLAELGLTLLDSMSLHAHWNARLVSDAELRRTVAELLVAEPPPLPPLNVEPWPIARIVGDLQGDVAAAPTSSTNAPDPEPPATAAPESDDGDEIFRPLPVRDGTAPTKKA